MSKAEDLLKLIDKKGILKTFTGPSTPERGVPRRDGSGQGIRKNRGRGGCPPDQRWRNEEDSTGLQKGYIGAVMKAKELAQKLQDITGNNEGIKALSDEDIKSIDKFFDSAGTGFENVINAAKKFGNRVISSYYKDNRAKYNW